ncbi:YlcG family protein [Klebsiella sp. WOUb02]
MNPEFIGHIRQRWQMLRLFRPGGTVLVDYRILKNFVRRHQVPGEKA